ncbi:MAG: hypothetical protein GX580_03810, partial [Candidatus Hydrogenedens sp.]|nr:hypothetical protein [Candidatus Hydrogenedens sp.]
MSRYLIGVDVGTTGTKSMLISEEGRVVAHAYEGYPCHTPGNGMVEQDAEDWWRALVKTVREVTAEPEHAKNVAAISLSLQGGTMVPVDGHGKPLHRAIVWSDKRCEKQAQAFAEAFGKDYMYQKSGWHLGNGLNAMQIAWLRENCPEAYENAAMFLSVPDYVSLRMSGRAVVDISDVGINQLADIRTGTYDPGILDFIGIREDQLAEIAPSATPVGKLLPEAAAELGLSADTLLVAGAHDQYAGLLGAGITRTGDILIGTGTAWVVTALTEAPDFESGFAQSIPAAGNWGSLVSLSSGGVCLDWFRGGVAGLPGNAMTYDEINEIAPQRGVGARGLKFYPYFNGSSFPMSAPRCKATLVGLDQSHDRYDIARAVMEGVAMQTVWTLDYFRAKSPECRVTLSGGASKSPFWSQTVANFANCPITTPLVSDLPCVGAAVMAGVGSGVFASCEEGAGRISMEQKVYEPDPA